MADKVLCLVAVVAMVLSLSAMEFGKHAHGTIRSEETDGYDMATVHEVDSATKKETRQSRRDIEEHASDLSMNKRTYSLQLTSGKQLRMSVERRSIDVSGAVFTELNEEGQRKVIDFNPRACFFTGKLENEEGFASLSLCDGEMVGSITTPHRDYEIHSVNPDGGEEGEEEGEGRGLQLLVTWQNADQVKGQSDALDIPEDSEVTLDDGTEDVGTARRSVKDRRVTIELCDMVDSFFLEAIRHRLHITNNSKIIEYLISKWSGVAHMLSNKTQVGWDIDLRLVHVDLWRRHPDWYKAQAGERIGARLGEICYPTNASHCDQITLHTYNTSDRGVGGLSWVGGICSRRFKCSVVEAANYNFLTELHELGHSMGLNHDSEDARCYNGTDPQEGFMGNDRDHFRECYKEVLARTLPKRSCLFQEAFDPSDIFMDFGRD